MIEVARFLAAHTPFRSLPAEILERVASTVVVEFFPAGALILRQGGPPATHFYVLRRGAVELCDGDVAVDLVEEGELFGFPSLLAGAPPELTARVSEDALCYLLDRSVAVDVFGAPSGMRFLVTALRDRISAGGEQAITTGSAVGDVARSPLVVVDPAEPIGAVAAKLTEAGCGVAVVSFPSESGIVTDRDFRARVVAAGVGSTVAVGDVATRSAMTIDASATADEAILRMLEKGVHHLPVVDDRGDVVAMLSDLDLLDLDRRGASRLRSEIQHASGVGEVAEAGSRIPDAVSALVRAGVDAEHVGRVVSTLVDALTERLLELGQERSGPAPVPFAWLALGSAGRREQSLVTDQDHALVYADGGEKYDEYFRSLSGEVAAGLEMAGIARCESKVMAGEEGWRGSESWWRARFADWMSERDRVATFLTSIAFDMRTVAGELDARALFVEAVGKVGENPAFLRRSARLALELRPPIGFLGGLVVRDVDDRTGVLDLKLGGLLPATGLARVFALEAGSAEVGTPARLRAAAGAGTLDEDQAHGLEQAFRLFQGLRLRHHVEQWGRGEPITNLIAPDDLGPIDRGALKHAFGIVRSVQSELAERLAPRILGR